MIQVLDQETINQIAAGEVIERPAAVVKELIENAIDAEATAITIEIKEGGISFIRITDNGSGIAKNEITTAFLRHATSKIRSKEDLLTVKSLGFRGEALSSIAAVAQVELITRQADDITGVRYEIAGGKEKSCQEIGCPEGTTFVVRNLFYNTPARRKFLKTKMTEGGYVQELVLRYSLAHPDIRFHYIADGKSRLQTSGDGQLKTNIFYNYGSDITKCLVNIEKSENGMTLSGFIGKPELSRGNRTFMNYFVNGRYIKSNVITSAIEHAYKKYLMNHRYPFTALMLSIDSDCIDVNVHPTKMEVRFTNQEDVYHLFEDAISSALQEISLIPEVALEPESKREKKEEPVLLSKDPEPFETKRMTDTIKKPASKQQKPVIYTSESSPVPVLKEETRITYEQKSFEEEITSQEKPQFRIVGQVFDTYWLIEYAEELLIIDQHAAHEKVLYEKLMKHLSEKKGITQNLAAPVVVNLSEREIEVLQVNLSTFEQIGFQIEHFGEKDYLITGVPADFLNVPSKELFLEMLDGLVEEGSKSHPEIVLDHCATMACKAAVKGNHRMSYAEAEKLIEQMLMMDEPYHCPHGRPTTIAMSRQEFEKKFKRIV
ncbi:MAG: DNA mismatch repair endonuclease MutL [Eubacterium sp.]|nr:DNA mismatch repair endonuclease MutL [Eubacterium sp.]